jgi:hypothetical protein
MAVSHRIDGGQGRNRTADASLFRAALYQLSYLATLVAAPVAAGPKSGRNCRAIGQIHCSKLCAERRVCASQQERGRPQATSTSLTGTATY